MKKNFLKATGTLICSALLVTSLAACGGASGGGNASGGSDAGGSDDGAATYRLAMCMSHQSNDFQKAIHDGAMQAAADLGVEVTVFDGENDAATQISQIEQCIAEKYDAIAFEPVSADSMAQVVTEAKEAGITVVNTVGVMTDWQNYVEAYCGGSNVTAGQTEMEEVIKLIGDSGDIAIIQGPVGTDPVNQRQEGYDNILKDYPGINVTFTADCNWVTDEAMDTVEGWLVANPNLKAIVCQNDGMAVGAAQAVKAAGLDIVVTGVDATSDGLEAIKNGDMTGTVSQDAKGQGYLSVETMVKLLNGETLSSNELTTENIWIDASNIDQYY